MNANASNDDLPAISESGPLPAAQRDAWIVLVVDDEPAIHEITKLVLADTSFAGIPVELHSAFSASEAKTFLESYSDTALILLDVVMETDDAGLRLVTYIREHMQNTDLQIVLRTGQPGMAPERDVIPGYDINGYFLKTEMVAQKLRSIVISSLRAYQYIKSLRRQDAAAARPRLGAVEGMQQFAIAEEFAKAIGTNSLHLLAQPQVHLVSGAIAAIELIPTWKRGDVILGAAQLAEEIHDPDLRLKFDEWLIRQGCAWARSWQTLGLPPFRISLPVLTEDIWSRDVLTIVEHELTRQGVARETLDLEVLETALLRERPKARDAVALMQSIGVSVTVVDFGLGLLSLSQLQRLLPRRVKIHKSFVQHVAQDRERSAIARSIIALAHTLGLTVIGDGIVREQDLQFLKWESCDVGQGDLLARPLAVADVSTALLSDAAPADWTVRLH